MGLLNIDPFGENKIEEKKTESTIDPVTDIIGENKTDNFNLISIDELLDMKDGKNTKPKYNLKMR